MNSELFLSIGDLCPQCKIGHIYPTGGRQTSSDSKWPLSEHESEKTTLVYDRCGHVVESLVVRDVGHGRDAVNAVEKKRDKS